MPMFMPGLPSDRIDIVMGVFNGEKYLHDQIDSIVAQTYQNWHLLIGEDQSIDNSLSILKEIQSKYPDKISLYPAEINLGLVQNFSRLLELSDAKYMMFCDQDDYWFPEKIEKSLQKIKEMENQWGEEIPLLVHTDMEIFDDDLKIVSKSMWKGQRFKPKRSEKLGAVLMQNAAWGCTMMFNRNLLDLALPIPEEGFFHDYWLALVAAAFGHIGYLDEPTLLYRQHDNNVVGSKNIDFHWFVDKVIKNPLYQSQTEKRMMKLMMRAYIFYTRYYANLTDQQKEVLESFIELKYQPLWKELYWRWKYDFFNYGFWSNVGLVLATIRMGMADARFRFRI